MDKPKIHGRIGLSLAALLTTLMLLGIDALARPDAAPVSAVAQADPRGRVSPGT